MKTAVGRQRLLRQLPWLLVPILLWWALRRVPLGQVWAALTMLSLGQIAVLVLVNAAILLLFGIRWWLILRMLGHPVPFLAIARYRLTGFSISYLTPGPQFGGEPLQVYWVIQRHGVATESAVASLALDKLFELLANFAFLGLGIGLVLNSGWIFPGAGWFPLALAIFALPAVYLALLWAGLAPLTWLAGLPARVLGRPRSEGAVAAALIGAEVRMAGFVQQRPSAVILILVLSALVWLALLLEYALALSFLGLQMPLLEVIALLVAARLAFLTPLPAGLGALEAGLVYAMGVLGRDPAFGLSLSLLIRARDLISAGLGLVLASPARNGRRRLWYD